jgi:phage-related minor tail protein
MSTEVELASLGVKVDATAVDPGIQKLHSLADAGGVAEAATLKLTSATELLAAETRRASGVTAASVDAHGAAAAAVQGEVQAILAADASQRKALASAGGYSSAMRDMADAVRQADQVERAAYQATKQLDVANLQAVKSTAALGVAYRQLDDHVMTYHVNAMKAGAAAQFLGAGHVAAGKGARLQAAEVLNLTRQLADVGVTAAMGMNPLMIAIQQGPQIADIFQTAAARGVKASSVFGELGSIVGNVLGKAGPFAVGAAVVGTLGAAFLAGEKDANRFANAIAITGGAAGITGSQYEAMVRRIEGSTDAGYGKAREAILTLVDSGRVSGIALENFASSAVTLSQFTGKAASDFAKDFAGMGDDVTAFAIKFNSQYHLLTGAQIEHIRLLQEQGRVTEAMTALSISMHERLGEVGPENLGHLERGWRSVEHAISAAWEALKGFGNETAGRDREIARLEAGIQNMSTPYNRELPNHDKIVANMQAELDALKKVRDAQGAAATGEQAVTDAVQRHATTYATLGDNINRAAAEQKKYLADQKAIADAAKKDPALASAVDSAARQKVVLEAIEKKYAPAAAAASNKAETAAESAAKAAARHAEQLAREASAMDATTAGALATARAYGVSDAAALRSIATADATAKAITKRGDVEAFVQRQLDLNAAKAAENAAKTVAGVEAQIAARTKANASVASGSATSAEANERLRLEAELRPLIAQADAASGEAKRILTEQIIRLAFARKADNAEAKTELLLAQRASQSDQLAYMEKELSLIGATNRERAVELAMFAKRQEIQRTGIGTEVDVAKAGEVAGKDFDVRRSTDNLNASLSYTLELLDQVDAHARDAAGGLASAFDGAGAGIERMVQAIGGLTTVMTSLAAQEEAIRVRRDADQKNQIKGSAAWQHAEILASRETTKARVGAYGSMAGAARDFFKEGSNGYELLAGAEKAFRIIEFGLALQSIAMKGAEATAAVAAETTITGATVAGTAIRTPLKAAEGIAGIFAALGPFGFPVAAAATAVMVAAGVKAFGGGGGTPGVTDMEDRQKAQGAGSVLGDASAKSDSLARAMEAVASNTNRDLEYSNSMLKSLRAIEGGIGAVAAALARTLGASGALSTDGLDLGKTTEGPGIAARILAPISNLLPGLFGGSKTRTLQDQGLQFGSQSLSDILGGGIDGQTYQQVLEQTKKKAFGVTYSNKTKSLTETGDIDADLSGQITQLIGSLKTGVLSAAEVLGVTGAEAVLDSFQVNLGKLSFKDMSGEEITAALNAIFGKLGDDLASAAVPVLTELQKVGEGAFETLARVARNYQVLDVTLSSIGMVFDGVGVSSLTARERLIDLAGGIDALVEQTQFFGETFLTEAERLAPIQAAVTKEMARLGLAGVDTRDEFKRLVLSLDVSTAAGADLYAALMAVAPAFAKVTEESDAAAQTLADAGDALSAALERQASAAETARDKFQGLADTLKKFNEGLYSGPAAKLSPEEQYLASKDLFEKTYAAAQRHDEKAIAELPSIMQSFLDASEDYNASSVGYFDDLDAVKQATAATQGYAQTQANIADQQLSETRRQSDAIFGVKSAVESVEQLLAAYLAAGGTMGGAAGGATGGAGTPSRAFDGSDYLDANADIAAAFQKYLAGDPAFMAQSGYASGMDADQFGQKHWDNGGKNENRPTFVMTPAPAATMAAPVSNDNTRVEAKLDAVVREMQALVRQGGAASPAMIQQLERLREDVAANSRALHTFASN